METPTVRLTQDATRANAALWTHYINQEYGPWLRPVGGVFASGMLGIGIANLYGAMWGEAIARAFTLNAPAVTEFMEISRRDALVRQPAPSRPSVEPSAVPQWWTRPSCEDAAFTAAPARQLARAGSL